MPGTPAMRFGISAQASPKRPALGDFGQALAEQGGAPRRLPGSGDPDGQALGFESHGPHLWRRLRLLAPTVQKPVLPRFLCTFGANIGLPPGFRRGLDPAALSPQKAAPNGLAHSAFRSNSGNNRGHARQNPHRRFRFPGHPAHRPPGARGEGLFRDRPLPEGGGSLPRDEAEGGDPLRRARLGARQGRAARAQGDLRGRHPGARHLLRRAGHGGAARRQGRGRPPPRIRPRRSRGRRRQPAVRGRLGEGPEISGLDEPRRPRHRAAEGLQGARHLVERADRHDRRRRAQVLRHAIPSRSGAHAARRRDPAQLRAQDRGADRRLDHARLQGRSDREDPRAGRQRKSDLRPLRRRRLGGCRGAHSRGDRRSAHLRAGRSRPDAARRSAESRGAVPRQLQHPAGACGCRPTPSSTRSKASKTPS